MIDHTLDPLPKRTTRTDQGGHGGRMWFSKDTVFKASHYSDVPWIRVAAPAVFSVSLVLAGLATGPGSLSGLALLVGAIGCAVSLPTVVLKALSGSAPH